MSKVFFGTILAMNEILEQSRFEEACFFASVSFWRNKFEKMDLKP
jgi:hypothetical protein